MELKYTILITALALISCSCSEKDLSDAYGQFDADEITISAEQPGNILILNIEEGDRLLKGEKVGQIDTIQISLKKKELSATINSIRSQIDQLNAQSEVLKEKLQTAEKEMNRLALLHKENAATQQQLDQATGQVNVFRQQLNSIETQKQSVHAELGVMQVRMSQIDEQFRQASIINPIKGTVLLKLAEAHEFINTGGPIYTIAALDEMILRVYISGAQLPIIHLGQEVDVLVDKDAESMERLNGKITWISNRAEFTPKMIQTKEERVTQVYAVEILVPNTDGRLKIGMPAEVRFNIQD